jgi:SAM-dependent methyltransferase
MPDPGSDPTDPNATARSDASPDYGASFADVYDEWYGTITDAEATAARVADLARLAGNDRVLELGVGSGRLAIPIAARGVSVTGIDSSPTMLDLLAAKHGSDAVEVIAGDMAAADTLVRGVFGVVLIAFNTLFNLTSEAEQSACLAACRRLLAPEGSLLVEAAIPGDRPSRVERDLSTVRVEIDRVVLSATEHDPVTQVVTGQHLDVTGGGIRLRPWRIRYLDPPQLDALAERAGLDLVERHADWIGTPLVSGDAQHVSRYRTRT